MDPEGPSPSPGTVPRPVPQPRGSLAAAVSFLVSFPACAAHRGRCWTSEDREHVWGLGVIRLQRSGAGDAPGSCLGLRFFCSCGESLSPAWPFHKHFGTFPPALRGLVRWPWRSAPVAPRDRLREPLRIKSTSLPKHPAWTQSAESQVVVQLLMPVRWQSGIGAFSRGRFAFCRVEEGEDTDPWSGRSQAEPKRSTSPAGVGRSRGRAVGPSPRSASSPVPVPEPDVPTLALPLGLRAAALNPHPARTRALARG